MFIKLTSANDPTLNSETYKAEYITPIYINIEHIIAIKHLKFRGEDTKIDIMDRFYFVKESPEEILKLIKECEK